MPARNEQVHGGELVSRHKSVHVSTGDEYESLKVSSGLAYSTLSPNEIEPPSHLASRVRERVLGMSCVAALISATDVGYDGVRLLDLDFERRNERILGLDENVIRLPFEFQPDSELRRHLPPPPILAQESFSFGSPAATNPFCAPLTDVVWVDSGYLRSIWLGSPTCATVWAALPKLMRYVALLRRTRS